MHLDPPTTSFGGSICFKSEYMISFRFSHSQDSRTQESRSGNESGTTLLPLSIHWKTFASYPCDLSMLYLSIGLSSKRRDVSIRTTAVIPLNWKWILPPKQFGFLMPRNQWVKKGVTILTGLIDLDSKEKLDCYNTLEERKSMSGIQEIP